MPQLPLPPDVFAAQGYPHEFNASTPHQATADPLEIFYSGVVNQTAYTGTTMLVDNIRAMPVVIGRSGHIDRIAFEVSTLGASSVARCGIYRSTSQTNLYPSSLVADGGEQDCSSTGVKITLFDFGLQKFLQAGHYWFAILTGVATFVARAAAAAATASTTGLPTTMGANLNRALNVPLTYGALPSAFPAIGAGGFQAVPPLVHVRFST